MYKNILVPVDGSELSEYVFAHVEAIARGCKQPHIMLIRVVLPAAMAFGGNALTPGAVEQIQVIEEQEKAAARNYLNETSKKLKKMGIETTTKLISGMPADSIIEIVNKGDIDLVIMSTHGRSGISRAVFGSVADKVMRGVCVPVLMVRAPGCGGLFKGK